MREVEEETSKLRERTEELELRMKEVAQMVRRLAERDRPPLSIYGRIAKKSKKQK